MSFAATEWAWKQPVKTTAKVILLRMAYLADEEGHCAASLPHLAKYAGVTVAAVCTSLNTLENALLIRRERQRAAPNVYHLLLAETTA
jgi:predicted transcriptional regulator